MDTLFKDLRYGLRSLLKQPAFTLIAIATLALAIGANSAMFTVVNSVLLRPLQFPESDRLVAFQGLNPPRGIAQSNMSFPDIVDWQKQSQVFEKIGGFVFSGFVLTNGDETERVTGSWVTGDYFSMLRVQPLYGRVLQPGDVQPGKDDVAVIGYGLWQRRFGGDRN